MLVRGAVLAYLIGNANDRTRLRHSADGDGGSRAAVIYGYGEA